MTNNQQKSYEGLIIKALSGFYYVRTSDRIVECRAKGAFRNEGISPCVGDMVTIDMTDNGKGSVVAIAPRSNSLIRPPVANIDRLAMIVSCIAPVPSTLVIDKLTSIAHRRNIPVIVIFTKIDLAEHKIYSDIYTKAGFTVYMVDNMSGTGCAEVKEALKDGITAFCGNSGAGKSSLLNAIFPKLSILTGDISKKLGRGRHTTRHVELYETGEGGYIADTPGFSAVDFLQFERMTADQLQYCFQEFEDRIPDCRYTGCSHIKERDCAIRSGVESGEIVQTRYQSYCTIYEELKQVKSWEL